MISYSWVINVVSATRQILPERRLQRRIYTEEHFAHTVMHYIAHSYSQKNGGRNDPLLYMMTNTDVIARAEHKISVDQ